MITAKDMIGEEWYHYPGELETINRLARQLPENPIIVNIGTGFGTSPLAFHEARPDAVVFTIDIEVCVKAYENWCDAGVEPGRIVRILGNSHEVGRYWPYPADMVFVDGAHGLEAVRKDILAWQDLVKPGGFLVFHDYGNPICPHVKTVIDAMFQDEPFLSVGYIRAYQR